MESSPLEGLLLDAERLRAFAEASQAEGLSPEESEEGLLSDIVEISTRVRKPRLLGRNRKSEEHSYRHQGTGLLVTESGFVLTAYHVVKHFIKEWKREAERLHNGEASLDEWLASDAMRYTIACQDGRLFPIDVTAWSVWPSRDIALIKAFPLAEKGGIPYRPYGVAERNLAKGNIVSAHGIAEKKRGGGKGHVIETGMTLPAYYRLSLKPGEALLGHFSTDIPVQSGYSGGAFVNSRGEYAGMVCWGWSDTDEAGGACIDDIRSFVATYAERLERIAAGKN